MKKLFVLLRQGNLEEVKKIIETKPELLNCVAGPQPKKDHGQSLLQVALKSGNFDIADYLIDKGIDVDFMEAEDDDPGIRAPVLFDAISATIDSLCINQFAAQQEVRKKFDRSDRALVLLNKIIANGADVNKRSSNGLSALNWSLHHAEQIMKRANLWSYKQMRLLFEMDKKDYGGCTRSFTRDSARSIIIRDGKIAMIHSQKYDYYKFPGGGIEPGESDVDALIRETAEEAGLNVIPDSIREYGYVHRIQKSTVEEDEYFIQDNYYYLCDVEEGVRPQKLDDYESDEHFTLEYVMPKTAILSNRTKDHGPKDPVMLEREARVLEMLLSDGLIER